MHFVKNLRYVLAGIAFLSLSSHAFASPVGTADVTNCAGSSFSLTGFSIAFVPGVGSGCIQANPGTSVTFSGGTFTSGPGTIADFTFGIPVSTFISFDAGLLTYSLTSFAPVTPTDGICSSVIPLAIGHSCVTAVGSPILYTSEGPSLTAISWTTLGLLKDGGNASTTPYSGLFTSQLSFTTAAIENTVAAGGTLTGTYSATLVTQSVSATPEPASFALLGTGLAMLGGIRRKHSSQP